MFRDLRSLYLQQEDSFPTESYLLQRQVERSILKIEEDSLRGEDRLNREEHKEYLHQSLKQLPCSYQALDASQPWLCYWILHSLDLLEDEPTEEERNGLLDHLNRCQSPTGGFGGGYGQVAHLATTYAAVCALCILGTPEALDIIHLDKLYTWLLSLKNSDGSFRVTEQGESDVRGLYCALAVAYICGLLTSELIENCSKYISCLQSFDGGLGGEPFNEGHGGYSYCGFAALCILNEYWQQTESNCVPHSLDIKKLQFWAINRQLILEGGFQGRVNKLVDSCYSFWQGGLIALLEFWTRKHQICNTSVKFSGEDLERYLLRYCQCRGGGFRDKPGKPRDLYHTCYALSGLSVAHQNLSEPATRQFLLPKINTLLNIRLERFHFAVTYFCNKKAV
ncbi:hypothetical protein GpartN1_g3528.t1 [Galdieria partita]|uniref:Protein farnesyltransferase subunit beta n=1 Tax=Galdieria partita TaxID=83374 RepID=A0A9C7UQP2_9RHOD|nr:hypothetical protein GpartN1_g3528.t1 [Galdieria partita]